MISRPASFTRLRLAFKMVPQGPFAWGIRVCQPGLPVHCELVFNGDERHGLAFSANYRKEFIPGTRFYEGIDFGVPGMWRMVELDPTLASKAFDFCVKEQGCVYDFLGILVGWTWNRRPSPEKWFCSEVCAAALIYSGMLLKSQQPQWYTPRRLYLELTTPAPVALAE